MYGGCRLCPLYPLLTATYYSEEKINGEETEKNNVAYVRSGSLTIKKIKTGKSLRDGPVEKKIPGGKGEGGGENIKNAHARQVAQGEKKNSPLLS